MNFASDASRKIVRIDTADILGQAVRLNRSPNRPTWTVIADWLGQLILSGELVCGQRLPSERSLADALNVSRMTLRHALDQLQTSGQIVRSVGGGGGSFVAEKRPAVDVSSLMGLSTQLLQTVDSASSRLISTKTNAAKPRVAAALALPDGEMVHEVVRVRFAALAPVVLEHSYFPARLFPDMLEHDLMGSLYKLLHDRYNRAPKVADAELMPTMVSDAEAKLMHMKSYSVGLHVLRTARSADGTPVEYSEDLFRTDLLRIMVSGHVFADER